MFHQHRARAKTGLPATGTPHLQKRPTRGRAAVGCWLACAFSMAGPLGCQVSPFACQNDDACPGGRCERQGWCSFPDASCTSGSRFADHAAPGLAGVCVEVEAEADAEESSSSTTEAAVSSTGEDSASATSDETDTNPSSSDPQTTTASDASTSDSDTNNDGESDTGSGGIDCSTGAGDLVFELSGDDSLENEASCSESTISMEGNVAFGDGQNGQAFHFRSAWEIAPGLDPDYLTLGDSEDLNFDTITIDAWVRQTDFNDYAGSNRLIFATRSIVNSFTADSQTGDAALYLHEQDDHFFYYKAGPGSTRGEDWELCRFPSLDQNMHMNQWVRMTATYDGNTLRCYVNGTLETGGGGGGQQALAYIGPAQGNPEPVIGRNYPGDIDSIRVFSRALTDEEVAAPWNP